MDGVYVLPNANEKSHEKFSTFIRETKLKKVAGRLCI